MLILRAADTNKIELTNDGREKKDLRPLTERKKDVQNTLKGISLSSNKILNRRRACKRARLNHVRIRSASARTAARADV